MESRRLVDWLAGQQPDGQPTPNHTSHKSHTTQPNAPVKLPLRVGGLGARQRAPGDVLGDGHVGSRDLPRGALDLLVVLFSGMVWVVVEWEVMRPVGGGSRRGVV